MTFNSVFSAGTCLAVLFPSLRLVSQRSFDPLLYSLVSACTGLRLDVTLWLSPGSFVICKLCHLEPLGRRGYLTESGEIEAHTMILCAHETVEEERARRLSSTSTCTKRWQRNYTRCHSSIALAATQWAPIVRARSSASLNSTAFLARAPQYWWLPQLPPPSHSYM